MTCFFCISLGIAKRSLGFALNQLNFALDFQFLVANSLAGNFLDCALGFFDTAFDLILVHDELL